MNVKDIRVARLRQLLNAIEGRGKQVMLASRIKKAPAQISQWINGTRKIEEETAREIELNARLPRGWLDTPIDVGASADSTVALFANEPANAYAAAWPFSTVTRQAIAALQPQQLAKLESVMMEFITLWGAHPKVSVGKKARN